MVGCHSAPHHTGCGGAKPQADLTPLNAAARRYDGVRMRWRTLGQAAGERGLLPGDERENEKKELFCRGGFTKKPRGQRPMTMVAAPRQPLAPAWPH
jgi:hypothetical protein